MGGKAFNSIGISVDRMDTKLYMWAIGYILSGAKYSNVIATVPSHIAEKTSHGDIDICVQVDDFLSLGPWLSNLDIQHKSRNGDVLSIAVRVPYENSRPLIQVDLIKTRPEWHKFAVNYFSYNDAGNLYGRIAHCLGFKLGFDGLSYVLRSEDHVISEITVTQDWNIALRTLAFDPQVHENGYKTYVQLFEALTKCPWFSSSIFLLANRNHVSRTRDAKRTTYTRFLEWLAANDIKFGFPWTDDNKSRIRQDFLYETRMKFPEFNKQYLIDKYKEEKYRRVSNLVNGDILSNISGKTGKELGAMISDIKSFFPDKETYNTFVVTVDKEAPLILYELWKARHIASTG